MKMSDRKTDQVLLKLDTLLDRVNAMDAKINKFNERLNLIEEEVKNIGFEIQKLNEDNAATAIQFSVLKTNINNSIEDLEKTT